ncbi:hypothetical protein CDO44_10460 [Pigmentiphaga sp. NML080357]|uniref:MarR family winged helix-turn-helix transcriptional regulator n=1 Tax=unclassified Pigmentiphaga TaxID=2626614 RepID=UPI000B419079|nr:MarR family transcriptional regulator [Pigmentiphaga sp. NML080357]OVZ59978.1 hypothetical protein CDO44_10460 [Pigmentiphaga sp. NML080357]
MTSQNILRDDAPNSAHLPVRLRKQAELSALEAGNIDPSALLVLLATYRAAAVLDRNQTAELAPTGLNCAQFNVLTVLHRVGQPLAMHQLATMMAVRRTNLSGIVRVLRDKGLVRQELNATDSRSLLVSISPQGEKFLKNILPGHWAYLEEIMSHLDIEDRETLVALLERMVHSIRLVESKKGASRAKRASQAA